MKLLFRQRFFSWLDSYDIYDENGNTVYTVEGKFGWGHRLHILDASGRHIATLKERIFHFLPTFELYVGEQYVGCIKKEFTLFRPRFTVECAGWDVEGDFFGWDYTITAPGGVRVASVYKELFRFTDTYVIDVCEPQSALLALLVVLAIDAEKCSNND
ncbi:MAG: LURP-one-related family protein [Oscillospiraceae bacterium]|nr:LURP-one-related family protein [Oscillospiraceae bacterium]